MSLGLRRMASQKLFHISALPLPPAKHLLINNLTSDPRTPSVAGLRIVQAQEPSLQRRARLLSPEAHYSFVSPFPAQFPYPIEPPKPVEGQTSDDEDGSYIEKWLAEREAIHERVNATTSLHLHYPENRKATLELIGLSETALRDCVPHLDVGDAFSLLESSPTGSHEQDTDMISPRQELLDVLGGHAVLSNDEFAPWSLRYSGHQFGQWAGQLGDGRAISILCTPHPTEPGLSYELQLKGAGRTPFARTADGLAVVRSSIREYLASEAMHALDIPTTRALALVSRPDINVLRERVEKACILTRVAPSFLRVGSFEALNPPMQMMFFGGGQQRADFDALRILGEWVTRHVLKLPIAEDAPWGKALVLEAARRNAKMVAAWQAYGFMHGVINTDNVSIMGLTIDYGPYAFMDVFDPLHTCNHSDEGGRYAYKFQPNMIVYALRSLLNTLAPLIGAESGEAVSAGWVRDANEEQITAWRDEGLRLVQDELEKTLQETAAVEYARLMHKRLGLLKPQDDDEAEPVRPLLTIMEDLGLDFHVTSRVLCAFTPESDVRTFAERSLSTSVTPEPERLNIEQVHTKWAEWLNKYAERINSEASIWNADERHRAMEGANPRFVLRQWVLEEVIAKVEKDSSTGKKALAKVMKMACNPFNRWGAEGHDNCPLTEEEVEERRLCGFGDKLMLGFQCSCSS
ncbi:UPF0061-domain-containing protein [Fistulina hepatica ATCC 64428]|uniref:Selenoprotein O n=1 Tax=Fistulina hepatica ATCC 64428 TaxID=1128425 RepID=A0A0D7AFZ7_9AGAR|nr:UPF0061-domain-containing protein [Fistulina hepatica ATCC 64428]